MCLVILVDAFNSPIDSCTLRNLPISRAPTAAPSAQHEATQTHDSPRYHDIFLVLHSYPASLSRNSRSNASPKRMAYAPMNRWQTTAQVHARPRARGPCFVSFRHCPAPRAVLAGLLYRAPPQNRAQGVRCQSASGNGPSAELSTGAVARCTLGLEDFPVDVPVLGFSKTEVSLRCRSGCLNQHTTMAMPSWTGSCGAAMTGQIDP